MMSHIRPDLRASSPVLAPPESLPVLRAHVHSLLPEISLHLESNQTILNVILLKWLVSTLFPPTRLCFL